MLRNAFPLLGALLLSIRTAFTAAPTIVSASYRLVPFQFLQFAEVTIRFDQDLYFQDTDGVRRKMSEMNQTTPGIPLVGGAWPRSMTALQGLVQICCGAKCTRMYGLGEPAGGDVISGPTTGYVFLGFGLPNTAEAIFNFFGYYENTAIPSEPDDRKLTFAFLLDTTVTFGAHSFTMALSGISANDIDTCVAANTFEARYGHESLPCGPPAQNITEYETNAPGFTYRADLLICEVMSSAGEKVARGLTEPIVSVTPPCTPIGAASLAADLVVLVEEFNQMESKNQLDAINNLLQAFGTRSAISGCENSIDTMGIFSSRSVDLGNTYACGYDWNNASQREEYNNDPCCSWSQFKCCAPRGVQRSFLAVTGVNQTAVQQQCPTNLGAVKKVFGILQQEMTSAESGQSEEVDINQLFDELFTQKFEDCRHEIQNSQWQTCNSDGDCWSGTCGERAANCASCKRYCEPPANAVKAMLRCLTSELATEVSDAMFVALGITTMDTTARINQMETYLASRFAQDDCDGPTSWDYKAGATWVKSSSGHYEMKIGPVNATGCLLDKECNYDSSLNQTTCEDWANAGLGSHFCARCEGDWCHEVSQAGYCEITAVAARDNATECALLGGEMRYPDKWSWSKSCMKPGNMTEYGDCFDTSICPGPNSPSTWMSYSFSRLADFPNERHWVWACSSELCYSNQSMNECWNSNDGRWWDEDYRNGSGLCVMHKWNGGSAEECAAMNMSYWHGVGYVNGVYDTEAKCTSPKCQLPREWQLRDMNVSTCEAQTGCNMPCEKCTVSPWSGQTDGLCSWDPVSSWSCADGKGSYDWSSGLCTDSTIDGASCVTLNGTWHLCANMNESSCETSAVSQTMSCMWNMDAACTSQECLSKGECDDWDLIDYNSAECQANGWQTGYKNCGACIIPFETLPNGAKYTECYTPLGVTGWPNYSANTGWNQWNTQRWSRLGCYHSGDVANNNEANCTLKYPGAVYKKRAFSASNCSAHGKGCRRRWGDVQMMNQQDCIDCDARWNVDLYTWTGAEIVYGQPVTLEWRQRGFVPINKIVSNVVPFFWVSQTLEGAVTKIIARRYATSISKKYFGRGMVYLRLACLCTPTNQMTTRELALCDTAAGVTAKAERGRCKCTNNGQSCEKQCPFPCDRDCQYTFLEAYVASSEITRRRLATGEVLNFGTVVRNAYGVIVGQTVGVGRQFVGSLPPVYKLCLEKDPLVSINNRYTVPDFAKESTTSQTGVGIPLEYNVVVEGNRYCANVTTQDTFFPIVRLASWNSPTAAPTPSVGPAPTWRTTSMPTIATTSGSSRTNIGGFSLVAFMVAFYFAL